MFGCDGSGIALLEPADGTRLSHADLRDSVAAETARLRRLAGSQPALVLIALAPAIAPVVAHLAALSPGFAAMPVAPELDGPALAALIARYQPELVIRPTLPADLGYDAVAPGTWRREAPATRPLHPDLGLVLSTSGSTGSPRCARLSRTAVAANARQIVEALGIESDQRAPTSLPLSYSYGLSVLHSHLAAGAAVILTGEGLTSRGFWQVLAEGEATSFAGVPTSYEMLRRLDIDRLAPPSLITLTQAGGAMKPALTDHFLGFALRRGGKMFVMYGQTEATARIAVLPAGALPDRLGAAGRAVPGGRLSTIDGLGQPLPPGAEGRILYQGPNVMMGYGEGRDDLARGDELSGRLETGDLGRLDPDGMLWITGREKRIAKVNGQRLNLDEIEARAAAFGRAAALDRGDTVAILLAGGETPGAEARAGFAQGLGLHSSQLRWHSIADLPLTERGKVDYAALAARLAELSR